MLFASIVFYLLSCDSAEIINMQPFKDDAMHIKLLKHRSQPDPTVNEMAKNKY